MMFTAERGKETPSLAWASSAAGRVLGQGRSCSGGTETHTHLPNGFQVELLIPYNLHSFGR